MKAKSWRDIGRLYEARGQASRQLPGGWWGNIVLHAAPKVKLHGSCAGVRAELNGGTPTVSYISRQQLIRIRGQAPVGSLYGFEEFADRVVMDSVFSSEFELGGGRTIRSEIENGGAAIVYGEVCGPGVQKDVACSKGEKFWALFGVYVVDKDNSVTDVIVDPASIAAIVGEQDALVRIIPWYGNPDFKSEILIEPDAAGKFRMADGTEHAGMPALWRIPLSDEFLYNEAKGEIDRHCLAVEECCPFMAAEFGIRGIGEGMVFYPVHLDAKRDGSDETISLPMLRAEKDRMRKLMFKVKGTKHTKDPVKAREKKKPNVSKEVQEAIEAFLKDVVTDAALKAQWAECFGEGAKPERQKIQDWIKHCGGHFKQAHGAMAAPGFDWKEMKTFAPRVVRFFDTEVGV